MNKFALVLAAAVLLSAVPAMAEKPISQPVGYPSDDVSLGSVTPTPGMWLYQRQMEQYEDPKVAVRERAEYRAVQRQRRLAAMRWYGFSNSRPRAGVDPQHSAYSPGWASRSLAYPYRWQGPSSPRVFVYSRSDADSTY
jgi:hypothetical protein